jgi:hypothetical protein
MYSPAERNRKIDEFIELGDGLSEFDGLLKRGGIHAVEQGNYNVIFHEQQDGKNLSKAQKEYLKNESKQGSLNQSKYLIGSLVCGCLAGMIQ